MVVYAVVPARSGSKGIADKNVRLVAARELMAYSIAFARALDVDRVLCSTDSERYAAIARRHGAEVPFLRSASAAADTAMEEDVIEDLHAGFQRCGLPAPDLFVWLRPTFLFRDLVAVRECIRRMTADHALTACRVVTEADGRLYLDDGGLLRPTFDDGRRSMIRRQSMPPRYRVFNTDVFRGSARGPQFLGDCVGFVVAPRICGLDIDEESDLTLAGSLIEHHRALVDPYVF